VQDKDILQRPPGQQVAEAKDGSDEEQNRRDIAERAQLDKDFDIAAAWEELTDLDASIENRVGDSDVAQERPIVRGR